jgi:hypothetical protein
MNRAVAKKISITLILIAVCEVGAIVWGAVPDDHEKHAVPASSVGPLVAFKSGSSICSVSFSPNFSFVPNTMIGGEYPVSRFRQPSPYEQFGPPRSISTVLFPSPANRPLPA